MSEALKRFLLEQTNTPNQAKAHQMQQFLYEVERLAARAALFDTPEYHALTAHVMAMMTPEGVEYSDDEIVKLFKAYHFNPVALFEDAVK